MTPEYVDANNRFVEVGIGALRNIVVQMFFISERVEALENEVKERLQVLRARTSDEYVGIAVSKGSSDS